jgi:hypothetical protein
MPFSQQPAPAEHVARSKRSLGCGYSHQEPNPQDSGRRVVGAIGGLIFTVLLIFSAPQIIGGIGLLKMQPWARILVIVLSGLGLLSIPIGTAMGIYGLWVLLNEETVRLFAAPPRVS